MPSTVRARAIFHGYVQGAGFRFTAKLLANSFAVTGWVRNLTDGTVELVVQGSAAEVNAYLDQLRSEMKDHISRAETDWISRVEDEKGFVVRF